MAKVLLRWIELRRQHYLRPRAPCQTWDHPTPRSPFLTFNFIFSSVPFTTTIPYTAVSVP